MFINYKAGPKNEGSNLAFLALFSLFRFYLLKSYVINIIYLDLA